ncbi:MAG TPA: tRNA 2-selenouridine(34) synthase MnmH [Bacteroidia bacterium]|nr:tRNA 2-selenouridine(34) synthase MnmH [Bacteroidia bacterium]
MSSIIPLDKFLNLRNSGALIIDVRSPSEFQHAHIPGSINLPLLNDIERKEVGIMYKHNGKNLAVEKGFELVGSRFHEMIQYVRDQVRDDQTVLVYCWRGGLRSNIMEWLLSTGGMKVYRLENGYKGFRKWVIESLHIQKKIVVIGGKTGSGKTELLQYLNSNGHQTIDLEQLAQHKGSVFGHFGMLNQPSNEMFENVLADNWVKVDENKILWIENESRTIGKCTIPGAIFSQMRNARVIDICIPDKHRTKRILNEYAIYPKEELKLASIKLEERLGGLRLKLVLSALEEDRMEDWVELLLQYYDKAYMHGHEKRKAESIFQFEYDGINNLNMEERLLSLIKTETKYEHH